MLLEDPNVSALVECVNHYEIDTLVLSASSRNGFSRSYELTIFGLDIHTYIMFILNAEAVFLTFKSPNYDRIFKNSDIPSNVTRMAPDFCNVYVISKTKIARARPATRLVLGNRTIERRRQFETGNLNDIGESVM